MGKGYTELVTNKDDSKLITKRKQFLNILQKIYIFSK